MKYKRDEISVNIELLDSDVKLPVYANSEDAGMDVHANETKVIGAGDTEIIKTGIKVSIPSGYEIQVRPRSGMSLKTPIRIANAPGTIDVNYYNEIGIIVTNTGHHGYLISKGDRIAQLILKEVPKIKWNVVDKIDKDNDRGGGFGSTGV